MEEKIMFSKNKEDLIAKINYIIKNERKNKIAKKAFGDWLFWFNSSNIELDEIKEENEYYVGFVLPNQSFYAVQIWEKNDETGLTRCIHTLYANKFSLENYADKIIQSA